MEVKTYYFNKAGPQNTEPTLKIARRRAKELGIKQIILASTHGETAKKALKVFQDMSVQLIVVTIPHSREELGWCMKDEVKKELKKQGVTVITTLPALGGDVNEAFASGQQGGAANMVVAETLYRFCQGMKVCVEIVLIAADTGAINMNEEIIAIAGTGSGADTVVVIKPAYALKFFDLQIREILTKPR